MILQIFFLLFKIEVIIEFVRLTKIITFFYDSIRVKHFILQFLYLNLIFCNKKKICISTQLGSLYYRFCHIKPRIKHNTCQNIYVNVLMPCLSHHKYVNNISDLYNFIYFICESPIYGTISIYLPTIHIQYKYI